MWESCPAVKKAAEAVQMRRAFKEKEQGPVTEMAIVNTFTKLIFGDEAFTRQEQSIIAAFQAMDVAVRGGSRAEMGEYLRNLGVREMIQLVSGLQLYLSSSRNSASQPMRSKVPLSPRLD
jgi:hypothetical protein